MAIPAMAPIVYDNGVVSPQICEAVGAPVNGANVISLPWVGQGIDPSLIDADRILWRAEALGASVTGASEGALAPDKLSQVINFTQLGTDQVRLRATLNHTIVS